LAAAVLVFIIPLNILYIPLFTSRKMPKKIPKEMQNIINRHKRKNKYQFAKTIFTITLKVNVNYGLQ